MRIVVTGGGTGGHVFPALEIARAMRSRGAEVQYFGSVRGQEGAVALANQMPFFGFPSQPIYSLRTPQGWASILAGFRAFLGARRRLAQQMPDAVFSTGGYAAAPIMAACRTLNIPYVIHESNSIPGRSNRLFARQAAAFTCVFHRTVVEIPSAIRLGQPIREELREAALNRPPEIGKQVLVTGGSQGSAFLNELVPSAAAIMSEGISWVHTTGPSHLAAVQAAGLPSSYRAEGFLPSDEMALAYRSSQIVVARSGGTLAEIALFRLPSVLIPLPTSADNHQLRNAEEFVDMKAAILLPQALATPQNLSAAVADWTSNEESRHVAQAALAAWDCPNAAADISKLVWQVAEGRR